MTVTTSEEAGTCAPNTPIVAHATPDLELLELLERKLSPLRRVWGLGHGSRGCPVWEIRNASLASCLLYKEMDHL